MRLLALTCEVLARSVYLCAARSPHVVDVHLNRRGLHDDPPNLRTILQGEIDAISAVRADAAGAAGVSGTPGEVGAPYDAILLA